MPARRGQYEAMQWVLLFCTVQRVHRRVGMDARCFAIAMLNV
jgi:hypothetical protein